MRIRYTFLAIFHWLCTIVGALTLVVLFIIICRSCYYNHRPESVLYGEWEKVDSEDGYNGHTLTFDWNGVYNDSNTGKEIWNYQFIEPDSLILFHHAFYEERYKILKLTPDTLIIRLSENIFHALDNGKEIEHDYSCGRQPIYTYIRKIRN